MDLHVSSTRPDGTVVSFLTSTDTIDGDGAGADSVFLTDLAGSQDESSESVACCSTGADDRLSYRTDRSGAVSLKTGHAT